MSNVVHILQQGKEVQVSCPVKSSKPYGPTRFIELRYLNSFVLLDEKLKVNISIFQEGVF